MTSAANLRVAVVGASSGLGRSIGVGMARRGASVALLARRVERLEKAAAEAGNGAVAVGIDVRDEASCRKAVEEATERLGGLDALVYTPGMSTLGPIESLAAEGWREVLETNVTGASLVTAAALGHLRESSGVAMYLSSVSASQTPPWPGLGSYAVSKAALDKLVEAWRAEHPDVAFTRIVVGECAGGEGESMTEFANGWDADAGAVYVADWVTKGYMTGALVDVESLVDAVDTISRTHPSVCLRSITVAPRLVQPGG